MQQTIKKLTAKSAAMLAMTGLMLGGFAMQPANAQTVPEEPATTETVNVTIIKVIEGEEATADNTRGLSFPMMSSWTTPDGTAGSGTFTLGADNNFRATTSEMPVGSSYTTNEDLTGDNVAATCTEGGAPFALTGYSTGGTFQEAVANESSLTPPAFTNLQEDQVVVVFNDDCAIPNEPVEPTDPETAQVTVLKYVDGEPATAETAQNMGFDMVSSSEDAEGADAGGGSFELNPANNFQAVTNPMELGSSYTTNEVIDNETVTTTCTTDGAPFAFQGYSTGSTVEEAEAAERTTGSSITLENIQGDQVVIVFNETCDDEVVVPGDNGELMVRSVDALDTTGRATGRYEDGWSYRFNLTVPTDEPNVAFRFSNWMSGNDMFSVANNMRISSEQADSDATVTITAANVYSDDLRMVEDLDPIMPGLQVSVLVEVRIPSGTESGSYVTNYGIRSTPDAAE